MPAGSRSTRLTLQTRKDQIIQILEESKEHADPTATVAPNGKQQWARRGKRTSNSLLLSDARGCSSAVNRAESELGTRSGRLSSFEFSFLDSWVPCKRPTHKAPQSLRYGQGRTPQRAMARRRLWPCILLSFCLVEHTRRQRVLARKGADGGGDPSSMMGLCWRLGGVHKAHDLEIPGRLLGTGCNISSRPRSIYGAKEWGGQDLKQSRTHADDSQYGDSGIK